MTLLDDIKQLRELTYRLINRADLLPINAYATTIEVILDVLDSIIAEEEHKNDAAR
jgi:hypothetical protein